MHALLSVVGTRGDVQPVLALALRLRDHGHAVHLCIPPNFMTQASELGFGATSVGVEMRAPSPGAPPKPIPDLIADQFDSILGASRRCDVILGANAHQYAAPSIAELREVPYVNALYAPSSLPNDDNARAWNERARERVNANRDRLGLSPIENVLRYVVTDHPWLATDPTLSPAPSMADMKIVQTGAWMYDDTRPLPDDLEAFLDAGEPPVYFGFGSMPLADVAVRVLVDAARAAGRRAIVARGWGGLTLSDDASDSIAIDDVNHGALFSRVAIVVHHGGAGTTHTAAQAGVPQVIVPMFGDQPYWASRVRALGVGTSMLPAELSVERLAESFDVVAQPGTRECAEALALQVSPNGATVAARLLSAITA